VNWKTCERGNDKSVYIKIKLRQKKNSTVALMATKRTRTGRFRPPDSPNAGLQTALAAGMIGNCETAIELLDARGVHAQKPRARMDH
jgi:hypothetical protein